MTNETNKQKMHPYSQVLQWVAEGKEIEANTGCTLSGEVGIPAVTSGILNAANHFGNTEYYQPQDFRLKPKRNIHQDLIDAFEKGAKVQYWSKTAEEWFDTPMPEFCNTNKYRIKPKPKLDIVCHGEFVYDLQDREVLELSLSTEQHCCDNFKVVFCGETGKLKSIELLKAQE